MPPTLQVASILLCVPLIWLSVVDIQTYRIPDLASFLVATLGIFTITRISHLILLPHLLAGILGFIFFATVGALSYRIGKKEYLGMGDAKLFGASLIWVGPLGAPSTLLIASASGIIFAIYTKLRHSDATEEKVPFGPFLSFGLILVWLYGPLI